MAVEITVNIFDIVQVIKLQEIKRIIRNHTVKEIQRDGFLMLMNDGLLTLEECTSVKVVINVSRNVAGCVASDTARTVRYPIGIRKVSSHFVRETIKEMISTIEVIIVGVMK